MDFKTKPPDVPGFYFVKFWVTNEPEIVKYCIDDEETHYVIRMGDECGYAPTDFALWGDKIEVEK